MYFFNETRSFIDSVMTLKYSVNPNASLLSGSSIKMYITNVC